MDYPQHGTYRLTFRQIEFCRHYAMGASCSEAARRAGYAESFIDKKGHLLLRHPGLIFQIRQMQNASTFVAQHQFGAAVNEFYDLLCDSSSEIMRFRAAREISRLFLKQPILPALIMEGGEMPESPAEEEEISQKDPSFSEALRIENEVVRVEDMRSEGIRIHKLPVSRHALGPKPESTDDLSQVEDTRPKPKPALTVAEPVKALPTARKQKLLPHEKTAPRHTNEGKSVESDSTDALSNTQSQSKKAKAKHSAGNGKSGDASPPLPKPAPPFSEADLQAAMVRAQQMGILGHPRQNSSCRRRMIEVGLLPPDF